MKIIQFLSILAVFLFVKHGYSQSTAPLTKTENGVTNIVLPGGASHSSPYVSATGAIKIKLPVLYSSTMLKMKVEVYNYKHDESSTILISGYNYGGGGGYWTNCSAQILTSHLDQKHNVYFGDDGVNTIVWIGEPTTTWVYPKVTVLNVQASVQNFNISNWDNGWEVSIDPSSFSSMVNRTVTKVLPLSGNSYWEKDGNHIFYDNGNVGIGTNSPTQKLQVVGGDTELDTKVSIKADGGQNYVASQLILESHDNYRGAGIFSRGVVGDWFLGNPYTDHNGKFIIAHGNTGAGEGLAQGSNALFTLTSGGALTVENNISNVVGSGGKLTLYDDNATTRNRVILGADVNGAYMQSMWGDGGTDAISFRNSSGQQVMTLSADDNVGVGVAAPNMKMEVEGTIRSGKYMLNIAEFDGAEHVYESSSPNKEIVKIKTEIPFTNNTQMPAILIEGYDYGGSSTLGLRISWYVYNGGFGATSASSSGSIVPKITLTEENSKVVIYLEKEAGERWYFSKFVVHAYESLQNTVATSWFKNWTFERAPITGNNQKVVSYFNQFESVGINSNAEPGYYLAVGGKAIAEEVKVKPQIEWPDYVFADDYQLPSLKELSEYIKLNKHLPKIPDAESVKEEGMFVGEMNARLLEKVEELTLYTIEQEETIVKNKAKINKLEEKLKRVQDLEKKLEDLENKIENIKHSKTINISNE